MIFPWVFFSTKVVVSFLGTFMLHLLSRGFSSLPLFVIGRKTLVVAGHITIQNLGGKKSDGRVR